MRLDLLKEARERFAAVPAADVNMRRWFHPCGNPACFAGWCATWWPDEFEATCGLGSVKYVIRRVADVVIGDTQEAVAHFFGVSEGDIDPVIWAKDQATALEALDELIERGPLATSE